MKEYLSRFLGKKVGILRMGLSGEISMDGTLKEIAGDVAVLVSEDDEEFGIPLDKITMVGPPGGALKNRSAGFLGQGD